MIDCELSLVVCPIKCDGHNSSNDNNNKERPTAAPFVRCTSRSTVCSFCGIEDEINTLLVITPKNVTEWWCRALLCRPCDHSEAHCEYDDLGCSSLKRARINMGEHEPGSESHQAAASDIIAD